MSRFFQRKEDRTVESTTATTTSGSSGATRVRRTLRVESQSYSINNGGASCTFTIPPETKWMTIEAWGGGGEAPTAACCVMGNGAGAGSYAQKTIYNPTGTLTICAGSSTPQCRINECNCACNGFPSFVTLNGSQIVCATGGIRAHNRMGLTNCYQCCAECLYPGNCVYLDDPSCLFISGAAGTSTHTQYCEQRRFGHMPTAPMTTSAWKATRQGCSGGYSGPCYGCAPLFPGGGGNIGKADGGSCCWSLWGAGGLVLITYGN